MLKLVFRIALLFLPAAALAQTGTVQGYCDQGGVSAAVSGLPSTNKLQGNIPSCTVTVYFTGTQTLVPGNQIFKNATGTVLGNPFTADALSSLLPGHFIFWAATGVAYDVTGKGGIAPNVYPQTVPLLTDVFPGAPGGGGTGNCNGTSPQIAFFGLTGNTCQGDPLFLDHGAGQPSVGLEYNGNGAVLTASDGGGYFFTASSSSAAAGHTLSSDFLVSLTDLQNNQQSGQVELATRTNGDVSGSIDLTASSGAGHGSGQINISTQGTGLSANDISISASGTNDGNSGQVDIFGSGGVFLGAGSPNPVTISSPALFTNAANGGRALLSSSTLLASDSFTYSFPRATGTLALKGTISSATGPLCANGTGGTLTDVGCTGGGGGAVASVANSDGTLTVTPTTGSVVASLNLAHANTWTAPIAINDGTGKAGAIQLFAGTAPSAAPTATVQINAPTAVTAYGITLPITGPTGTLKYLNCAATPCVWDAGPGGVSVGAGASLVNSAVTTSGANRITTNLLAEYLMTNCGTGASATCPDTSGNSATAAFGSGSSFPAVNSYGVSFTPGNPYTGTIVPQYLNLPSSVNGANLFIIDLVTYNGVQNSGTSVGSAQWNNYPAILATQGKTTSDTYILGARSAGEVNEGSFQAAFYNPGSSTFATTTSTGSAGHHVLAVYTGAPNRIWWDGVEQTYPAQNSSAIPAVTTSWTIGGAPGDTGSQTLNAFQGSVNYVAAYNVGTPDATVSAMTPFVYNTVAARAGFPVWAQSPTRTASLVWIGDSIGAGFDSGGTTIQQYIALNNTYTVTNVSVAAITAQTADAQFTQRVLPFITQGATTPSKCFIALGTNDVSLIGATPTTAWGHLVKIGQQCHKAGAQTILVTMLSRTGQDANKNALNTIERQYWKSSGAFDQLADVGEAPTLGADGASSNATYFASDGIHIISAGQQVYAGAASNAINNLDGFSDSLLHIVNQTTPYTMTVADKSLAFNGTNTAVTLPLCTGMTGASYFVIPLFTAVTVTNSSDAAYAIVGSSSIAAATGARFLVNLTNTSTGGGCNYVRIQ